MPYINNDVVGELTAAWQRALPSQVNDAFYQIVNGKAERILAFDFPKDDLRKLLPQNSSKKDISDLRLSLYYGYGTSSSAEEVSSFKVLATIAKIGETPQAYYELMPLTYTTLQNYLSTHVIKPVRRKRERDLDVNIEDVTDELIPPVLEQFFAYAWQSCDTSRLVDQTEALYQGNRLRIERSVFDGQVCKLLGELYDDYNEEVLTVLFMGIHQVIPGDPRIYPFGPVFQSYIPGTLTHTNNSEALVSDTANSNSTPMHPVNFELSYPCPPACDPPDDDIPM